MHLGYGARYCSQHFLSGKTLEQVDQTRRDLHRSPPALRNHPTAVRGPEAYERLGYGAFELLNRLGETQIRSTLSSCKFENEQA